MKINKNIFICLFIVLMLFICVNAASASDTLDTNLNSDDATDVIQEDTVVAVQDKLGASGDTYIVDANGGGDFRNISSAVSTATGGETIFVKNGDYSEANTLEKDILGLDESEPVVLPNGTIYVSQSGSDENDGLSEANAVATFAHAVDIVKARENKTATVYVLNGYYVTDSIDIDDDSGVSLSIIGQEKGNVEIEGTGSYIFDVYGNNLVWNFKNIDFVGLDSTARTSAALVLYSKNGNFTVDDCNFRNINTKMGAIAIGNDNGNTNITNCIIEDMTGSASTTSILTVNGDGTFILDNVEIRNCRLNEDVASSTASSYLRSIIYVNTYEADVTISNSRISGNKGPMMSLLESRSKLTIVNTEISGNVMNTSLSGANGGDVLIWASNDNSDINVAQCVITDNTIVKSGKGLFFNQRGSINVEYSDIGNNDVDAFIGSTSTITANNNWWATNDQPDSKIDNWVIMNVEVDDSDLAENNKITLTIDFNHVKTSSGNIEELTGGEIPKESYAVEISAQDGEITPTSIIVNRSEVKSQTFTVTEINDVITLNCDGDIVEIGIEGDAPYDGIVYVNVTGDDDNEGTIDAPVASITKAIEIANRGSGQIIINEGTYTGNLYHVTQSLNITGVGNVILNADNARLFTMEYGDTAEQLILTNLVITGADNGYGQAIYSFADELILDNVNITDNPGSGSLIVNYGKLTINDSVIANHNGDTVIQSSGSKDIIINNTIFENNTVADYAIVYASSTSGNAIVENTIFRNNTGQLGIFKVSKKTNVKDSKFIDNTNMGSYGGAISDCDELNVTNSIFINNKANKNSGAINVGYNRLATITKSTFINNTANLANKDSHGDAISNSGKLTINYCILLTNAENSIIYSDSEYDVNAQYNWWGTNDDPSSLNGVGIYYDDDDEEVDSVIDSSYWVYMNVTTDMVDDIVLLGDSVQITVDFTNYIDSSNALQPLSEMIPEVNVSANALYGDLDATVKTTVDGIAEFVYNATVSSEDIVNITSSDATVSIPIFVDVSAADGIIYVSPSGDDSNDGLTKKHAVKTLSHAMEIATQGQIVLLDGVHTTGDLGSVYEDLNITGEGKAIIDAGNNNRILYVGSEAKVIIKNVIMVKGYCADESGGLLGNSNELTLINCTLANSSAGQNNGGAIFNVGKLTIVNTTIANCSAKQGGAIFSQCDNEYTSLKVFNSTFENNFATGNDMNGGGAIYAQRNRVFYEFSLTVDNSTFINNRAEGTSSGGAIALTQLDATAKITNSKFIANHANAKDGYGGGAIYVSSASNLQRYGTMTISGTLFENNTCGVNGGAIYGRVTTINVANSVLINNTDANGLAIYGYRTDSSTPSITLNDNWWGSNDSPKGLIGGNNGYKPTLNRWAILTATNDSAIEVGSTVELTVSINNYTTGTVNGTMSKPIPVKRDVTIKSTDGEVKATLENGEFTYDYTVPENIRYLAVTVDDETVELLVISSNVKVEVDDIVAKKYEMVNVVVNVTSEIEVNSGEIELYADTTLIDTIPVIQGKAIKDVIIPCDIGTYELIAKYFDSAGFFEANESSATLTVDGIIELRNETFFNFFDNDGLLRDGITGEELVFHGNFSGLGVDVITVPRELSIIGDEAILNDMSLSVVGDSKVTDMTFIVDNVAFSQNNGAVIYVTGENVELNNVFVNYNAPNTADAFGIYAESANGFKLINSTIIFDSNNAGAIHHALHIVESDEIEVSGNTISASLPARDIIWNTMDPWFNNINQETVLAIGIQGGNDGVFTQNEVNVVTNGARGVDPTIDSIIVYGANNLEISWNNISHVDTINSGKAGYSNAVDLYAFDGITVKYNNILVNSTAGIEAKGTAYPIQATGSYCNLLIDHNNLTSISQGPALAIYSQNYDGSTDITITFNNINVTGFATEKVNALVSGIELQDTIAHVYNNTIYSQTNVEYDDANSLYGISYSQYTEGTHSYDIKDNTIFTEGKYAIYLQSALNTNVTENTLYAYELKGDEAVSILSGENNIIRNNRPSGLTIVVSVDDVTLPGNVVVRVNASVAGTYTVVLNDTAGTTVDVTVEEDNGEANATITEKIPAGSYTAGIELDSANITNATFNVFKSVNTIVVDVVGGTYPDNVTVNVIATLDGEYVVDINGTEYTVVANGEGIAVNLAAGSYYANVSGDYTTDDYDFVTENATFSVEKGEPSLVVSAKSIVYGNDLVVKVTSSDNYAYRVNVTVGDQSKLLRLKDGKGTLKFSGLGAGTYTVVALYKGDSNYVAGSANATVKVKKAAPQDLTVVTEDITYGEDLIVNVTLSDNVAYRINVTVGDQSKLLRLKDGKGTLKFSGLGAGTYTVVALYKGDANYSVASAEASVEVKKATPMNLKVVADAVVYGGDLVVGVSLDDEVAYRINVTVGDQSKLLRLKNGKGTLKFTDLEVGTYIVTALYKGDANYSSASARIIVEVKNPTPNNLVVSADAIAYGEDLVVNVSVDDELANRINITVGNESKLLRLKDGKGSLKFRGLAPGCYIITAHYSGDDNHSAVTVNALAEVKKATPANFTVSATTNHNNDVVVTVGMADDVPNRINVTVGNESKLLRLKDGEGSVKFTGLEEGTYTVTATYKGDDIYSSASVSTSVEVSA